MQDVFVDRHGRLWLEGDITLPDAATPEAVRQTVEAAYGDETKILKGVRIILVDRRNAVWLMAESLNNDTLYAFDGKNWTERRPTDVPHPDRPLPPGAVDGADLPRFEPATAIEDTTGSFFISDGRGIHRRSGEGKWDYLLTAGDMPDQYFNSAGAPARPFVATPQAAGLPPLRPPQVFRSGPGLAVGADGSVYAFSRSYRDSKQRPGLWRFDSKSGQWAQVDLGADIAPPSCFVPLPDGAFLVGGVWRYGVSKDGLFPFGLRELQGFDGLRIWRSGSDAPFPECPEILKDLVGNDPARRDTAAEALELIGPTAVPQLKRSIEASTSLVLRDRIQVVLRQIEADRRRSSRPGADPEAAVSKLPYGGHLNFKDARLVVRRSNGEVLLDVAECEDLNTHQIYKRALMTIQGDVAWSAAGSIWRAKT